MLAMDNTLLFYIYNNNSLQETLRQDVLACGGSTQGPLYVFLSYFIFPLSLISILLPTYHHVNIFSDLFFLYLYACVSFCFIVNYAIATQGKDYYE